MDGAPAPAPAAANPRAAKLKLPTESERRVWMNNREKNFERSKEAKSSYKNKVSTTKYTLLTFLPVNLFEQFSRVANAYFLTLLILQLIPQISSLNPLTTALPLFGVLLLTGIKDFNDDWNRRKSDRQVNRRKALVLRDGKWTKVRWEAVETGDIVKLVQDDFVPADLVLLSSDSAEGECYVETAELDGETNLKIRRADTTTCGLQTEAQLSSTKGRVFCEPPNNRIHKFEGTLYYNKEEKPIDNDALLLRGCVLRNTAYVHCVVVFAGRDTKLMQNSGKSRFKRTHIDLQMNSLVVTIFIILAVCCAIAAILNSVWESDTGDAFQVYLVRDDVQNSNLIAFLNFFSYIIVMNTLVPLSLYVSVEMIRLGQSFLINWDNLMFHEETETFAAARTTTLNEELGQIDYVFSDKTGTLTQNVMKFLQCSCKGEIYGKEADNDAEYDGFVDDKMRDELESKSQPLQDFFRLLALCHTVEPETIDGKVVYQAQSPDEKALVEAARDVGFVFQGRVGDKMSITADGVEETYEILNILAFNSTRKRMSIVFKDKDGKIFILSKGADTIMRDLLSADSLAKDWPPLDNHLHIFAKDGLRTLVLARRELDQAWYTEWSARYNAAETALADRETKVAEVAVDVESDLELVGATAIEDKLQVGVPQAIANIKRAGVNLWVLTGDKQETAINIGYSCRLLSSEMEPLLIVSGSSFEEVDTQLTAYRTELKEGKTPRPYGLVIDGPSLVFPLPPDSKERRKATVVDAAGITSLKWTPERLAQQAKLESKFLEVVRQCRSVICCRVSPLQKAQVVTLVKKREGAITLAIGDGANDVGMIKAAHIGIGISGLEGRQAVLTSDFSIAQFRFLERLLLVHGRWSYLRMCSFLNYFFYKNFAFTMAQFWYAFFCAYSAQTLYDQIYISMYNVVFTSLPIMAVGLFEQDISDTDSIRNPILYEAGPKNKFFSRKKFYFGLAKGTAHSLVIFFTGLLVYRASGQINDKGEMQGDFYTLGTTLAFTLTIVVNLQLAMDTLYWTWMNFVFLLCGPVAWLILFANQYTWNDSFDVVYVSSYFGIFTRMFRNDAFWAQLFITNIICLLPVFAYKWYATTVHPTPTDIVREQIRFKGWKGEKDAEIPMSDPHNRSTFAFSQQDNAVGSLKRRIPSGIQKVPSREQAVAAEGVASRASQMSSF